ncbi:hypothetical protein COC42_09275 [Sphingomonas spermidinifaciens]|uniref:Uncharacterized protein n=1 Tax=Sphingomonas spermidinifaciens TaxID=1141889 RepID=A0A2A4B8N0_9SPHN|nr:hypothetical protein COC42_09275 [Sphingomonas spermidinifaciens]
MQRHAGRGPHDEFLACIPLLVPAGPDHSAIRELRDFYRHQLSVGVGSERLDCDGEDRGQRCQEPDSTGPLMTRIFIDPATINRVAQLQFDVTAYPTFDFDKRINRRDAEEMLNVDPSTFSRAVKNGELPRCIGGTYDRFEVLDLARTRLSVSEALARWASGSRRLPLSLKGRGAPIRTGMLGWSRAEAQDVMAS